MARRVMAEPPTLVALLERSSHVIGLYLERTLAPLGITQAEAHVLGRLGRGGDASPNELHHLFGHKRSTLTGILDRLESRGYVTRAINPNDRRSFIVTLTEEGKAAATRVVSAVEGLERRVAAQASERDLTAFLKVLETLVVEADETPPQPGA